MKIVHSLWTKRAVDFADFKCHWIHPRYLWYSWVLSAHQAFRLYGELELCTDSQGAKQLVDWLQLPYTSVKIILDDIPIRSDFWVYGKLLACAQQQEPFFHIDGDVYLWKRLPTQIEQTAIICQSFEMRNWHARYDRVYDRPRKLMEQHLKWLPDSWRYMTDHIACNTAIFGGQDVECLRGFADDAIALMESPANEVAWNHLADRANGWMNCVIEQQLFYCSAKKRGRCVIPLFFVDDGRPRMRELGYSHMSGEKVSSSGNIHRERLMLYVERHYPREFQLIKDTYG